MADELESTDEYDDLGKTCSEAGPVEGESKRLVKLALSVGSQSVGAVHSHVNRTLQEDVDPDALPHVVLLSIPTIGFPKAMAVMSWIDDIAE